MFIKRLNIPVRRLLLLCRNFSNGGICKSTDRLDGKIVVVTGGNTGIGKETAEDLVKRGLYFGYVKGCNVHLVMLMCFSNQ